MFKPIAEVRDKNRKRIKKSDRAFRKIRLAFPIILKKYKPIVLHGENIAILEDKSVIIAPNHQRTSDSLVVTALFDKNIHWAALKRFFDAEDSIFNNSKNPLLCRFTARMFKKLEYFPIERARDNPKADNSTAIRDMFRFLKENQYIGIFPEGTTNKTDKDFGEFDRGFAQLALSFNAYIQPITLLWIKSDRVIVNAGKPFPTEGMTRDEIYEKYTAVLTKQLEENRQTARQVKMHYGPTTK